MEQRLSQADADEIASELTRPIFRSILDRIGDRWSVLVLLEMRDGPRRFNEMHRGLPGISRRMLTFTLRNLERDGLIERQVYPTVPPKVEYSQTPVAGELRHTLEALAQWALRNRAPVMEARAAFDERELERKAETEPEGPRKRAPRKTAAEFRGRVPSASDRRVNGLGPAAVTTKRAAPRAPRKVLRPV